MIDALNAEPDLEGFAVVRERDEHGGDALRVLAAAPASALQDLGDRLAERLRVRPALEAISRSELDKLIYDPRQRKPMIVIDRTKA